MSQPDYKKFGLPRYFIKIGITLIVLPIVFMVVAKLLYENITGEFGARNVEIMKTMFGNCLILGLTFISFSRSKIENESTFRNRLASFMGAFVTGITIVMLTPIFDIFGQGPINHIDSRQLITFMLIMSMLYRYSMKKEIEKQ